jgi:signal transduction histidine kinase
VYRQSDTEMRVLVLAPKGRDASLLAETLRKSGASVQICTDTEMLLQMLEEGAAAALMTDEVLSSTAVARLGEWLVKQPPWSDMPFIVLTSSGVADAPRAARAHQLRALGNVTILERPVRPETVESATRVALRARIRQFEIRHRQTVLARANADLEQFAFSASHDLREPLRTLAVYSELVNRRYGPSLDAQGKELLDIIRTAALRMQDLIDDLLVFVQAGEDDGELPEPVDAAKPLGKAVSNLSASIEQSHAVVNYNSLPAVRVREVHLQQLFQNLIGNALKYRSEQPPVVSINAEWQDGHWVFAVRDNGIGIAPEYRNQIFGIFKRLHRTDEYAGTGMGLAICQRIIERYRGRIWVESELGQGSTFFFIAPA